jgi:hypothetical protein
VLGVGLGDRADVDRGLVLLCVCKGSLVYIVTGCLLPPWPLAWALWCHLHGLARERWTACPLVAYHLEGSHPRSRA